MLRYASYVCDPESGLYYCSARYYDPATRQWTSGDPAKADGEESAYQYCSGRPVGSIDPDGCKAWYVTGFKKVQMKQKGWCGVAAAKCMQRSLTSLTNSQAWIRKHWKSGNSALEGMRKTLAQAELGGLHVGPAMTPGVGKYDTNNKYWTALKGQVAAQHPVLTRWVCGSGCNVGDQHWVILHRMEKTANGRKVTVMDSWPPREGDYAGDGPTTRKMRFSKFLSNSEAPADYGNSWQVQFTAKVKR